MIYYFDKLNISKFRVVLIYIFCLNLLYPIYSFVIKSEAGKSSLVTSRYKDGRDASFGLRNSLNSFTYNEYILNSTLSQKIFGKGSEASRKSMISQLKMDILPHNDFIRFSLDFGLLCTILYLTFLFRIARGNIVSFILLLLYLFSFYHNMIYDFFLIAVFIYFSGLSENYKLKEQILIVENNDSTY